jgi:serine/threonine protein kinase
MARFFRFVRSVVRDAAALLGADSRGAAWPDGRETDPHAPTFTLFGLLGEGDSADVHLARADDGEPLYVVKVSRLPAGRAALEAERAALTRLLAAAGDTTYRRYLPDLVESLALNDGPPKRVNVFQYRPGFFTLEQVHARHPALDGRHLAWIFKRLLTVLGFAHRQGIVHGAVLPCHALIHPGDHGLQLVGWGQSVASGRPLAVIPPRYRDWYPPEALTNRPASPATDLLLAARCLTYLAGGTMPAPMRRFVSTCLLEAPRMRPGDAWELLDEFDELLRRLYGPPTFHPLTLT